MIYFTADLHFGHDNIIRHTNRPFSSVPEMNETIIENFNRSVGNNDTVFILGDVAHRIASEEANNLIRRLNGKKILIKGNHDLKYQADLFEKVANYLEVYYQRRLFCLMHYPLLAWHNNFKGSFMLHGHIHQRFDYNEENRKNRILRYDVGVDANNFRPVSAEEIISFFDGIISNPVF